jgi:nitronate monooxygenase
MPTPALHTSLCDLLHIDLPIVQALIGSATSAALVAAVANAGGLGRLSATWRSPEGVRQAVSAIRTLTPRPCGVYLGLSFLIRAQLDAGQCVGLAARRQPAGAIVATIAAGAIHALRRGTALLGQGG